MRIAGQVLSVMLAGILAVGSLPFSSFAYENNEEPCSVEEILLDDGSFLCEEEDGNLESVGEEIEIEPEDVDDTDIEMIEESAQTLAVEERSGVIDNLTWQLSSEGVLTISGSGDMMDFIDSEAPWRSFSDAVKKVVISSGVTSIGAQAFYWCEFDEFDLPDSITKIGSAAFYCSHLDQIKLPKNLTVIGDNAFYQNHFKTIELPDKLERISSYAFSGCSKLEAVVFPASVKYIENSAFENCNSLTSVTIPGTVVGIGDRAFESCKGLETVVIKSGVERLSNFMFYECNYLENVVLEEGLKEIGADCFGNCINITKLTLPSTVTTIGSRFIKGCHELKTLELPEGLRLTDFETFSTCGITEVVLPESVDWLPAYSFYACASMTKVYIPKSMKVIGDNSFYFDDRITDVYYGGDESDWLSIEIGIGNENLKNATIHYNYGIDNRCGKNALWEYADGVLTISGSGEMYDFVYDDGEDGDLTVPWWEYHTQIKKVIVKQGITSIGACSFIHHYALTDVYIPISVKEIRPSAFYSTFVKDIYYAGSELEWKAITVGKENDALKNATIHYGEEEAPEEEDQTVSLSYCGNDFTFKWTPGILLDSKTVVDAKLAQISLILSAMAEYKPRDAMRTLDDSLIKLGLLEESEDLNEMEAQYRWHKSYGTENMDKPTPAHTFALKTYKSGNRTYKIVTIICRGTDLETDFVEDGVLDLSDEGFITSAQNVYDDLITFLAGNGIHVNDRDVRYYITGHSLGGATANLLDVFLVSSGCYLNDITCYTYASPLTAWDYDYRHKLWGNSMNIIKPLDAFAKFSNDYDSWMLDFLDKRNSSNPFYMMLEKLGLYSPLDLKAMRYGTDIILNVEADTLFYYNKYTGKDRLESDLIEYHVCEAYMAYLQGAIASGTFRRIQETMRTGRVLTIYCPVDISVVDQNTGKELLAINDNKIVHKESDDISACVFGDKKIITLPLEGQFKIILTGTDVGSLRYVIQDQEQTSDGIVLTNTMTFENVELTKGKEMISVINNETSNSDVQLLVVDENGVPQKEILEDGKEIDYSKYGDILPEDIPEDGIIPDGIWLGGVSNLTYDAAKQTQNIRVYDNMKLLVPNVDYKVSYKNNKNAYVLENSENPTAKDKKSAPQIVLSMKGNYSGKEISYFSIEPLTIADNQAFDTYMKKSGKASKPALAWNGKELKAGKDYTLEVNDSTATFTGIGNFTGTRAMDLAAAERAVKKISIDKVKITAIPDQLYMGEAYTLEKLKAKDGVTPLDFSLTYNNVKLIENVDYRVAKIIDAKSAGKATVVLEGLNAGGTPGANTDSFVGEKRITFKINAYPIAGDLISITSTSGSTELSAAYRKSGAAAQIRVMYGESLLRVNRDYTVKYSGNTGYPASKATVVVSGKGNYSGKISKSFTVYRRAFSKTDGINVITTDVPYSPKAGKYTTTVKVFDNDGKLLKAGTDYEKKLVYQKEGETLDSKSHPAAGDVITVLVTGRGGYSEDTVEATYTILPAGTVNDISKATIKIKDQSYNKGNPICITSQDQLLQATIGKGKTPLKLSTDGGETGDLMVVPGSYVANKYKGTAQVTFMGIGNYSGTKTVKFKIGTRSILDIWFGWARKN